MVTYHVRSPWSAWSQPAKFGLVSKSWSTATGGVPWTTSRSPFSSALKLSSVLLLILICIPSGYAARVSSVAALQLGFRTIVMPLSTL